MAWISFPNSVWGNTTPYTSWRFLLVCWRRRAPLRPQLRAALRRPGMIDSPRPDVDHRPVVVARGAETHQLVADIAQHPRGIALQRVAPPARPRLLVTEDVAPLHRHRQLPRELPGARPGVQDVAGRTARLAPVEPVGTDVVPVRPHLQDRFLGKQFVVAADRHAPAVLPGAAHIPDELGAEDLQRLLRLGDL